MGGGSKDSPTAGKASRELLSSVPFQPCFTVRKVGWSLKIKTPHQLLKAGEVGRQCLETSSSCFQPYHHHI